MFASEKGRAAEEPLKQEQLKQVLKRFDADGDGKLSKDELRKAFTYMGSRFPNYRVHVSLQKADADRDGAIDVGTSELDALVKYVEPLGYSFR